MRWLDPLLRFLVACLPFLAGTAVAAIPAPSVEIDVDVAVDLPAEALPQDGAWALTDLDVEVELEVPVEEAEAWVESVLRVLVEDPRRLLGAWEGVVLDRAVGLPDVGSRALTDV